MDEDRERLRGWKSIAGHLRVTPGTAIRWAKNPDFPVIRTGNGRSVYAYPDRLDLWLARGGEEPTEPVTAAAVPDVEAEEIAAPAQAVPDAPRRSRRQVAGLAVATLLIGGAAIVLPTLTGRDAVVRQAAPAADAERHLLEARTRWAERTPDGLARATAMFQAIIARYPNYAPAFAGLADSYLLSCEFGTMPRAEAFARARAAVTAAAALAPKDPDAQRIAGFLSYWTTRDIAAAAPHFEAAVADPGASYLAYLWFGNALVDAGRVDRGREMLERALALAPDSPVVLTNHALALWQTGDEAGALRRLDDVLRRFPNQSSAAGMSALFHLTRGEAADYLIASERWAALIGDRDQIARIGRERAAFARGGSEGLLRQIADTPSMLSSFWHGGNLPAAIAASVLGDRARLGAILARPAAARENWRPLHFPAAAFLRWKDDSVIRPLLEQVFGGSPFITQ